MLDASAGSPRASSSAGAERQSGPEHGSGSSSSVFGDDEFHDCRSTPATARGSPDSAARVGPASPPRTPRQRSRTDAPGGLAPAMVHRSSTTKEYSNSRRAVEGSSASQLVEARARRAIRAMAEACTTGVSVREADEKRVRTFSRILTERGAGSGSGDKQPVRPAPMQMPLHHASSHANIADMAALGRGPG
ncbi:hypothetical protein H4R19_001494, partial [Coemansia spiralis]